MKSLTRLLPLVLAACSPAAPDKTCAALGVSADSRFPDGTLGDGHPDLRGAKAAGQARAGRIKDASLIRQSPDAKFAVTTDDFLLINDKIAVYIEAEGLSDGYMTFGGEVLALAQVGDDGLPLPTSQYGETLVGLSRQTVNPDKVSVLADGSDGGEAIIRVSGKLANIPFLDVFASLLPDEFGFPAALDYVLTPGAEAVRVRLHIINPRHDTVDFSLDQNVGFFHSFRHRTFTESKGFAPPAGMQRFVAFEPMADDASGFAWRLVQSPLNFLIEVSGFQGFQGTGFALDVCQTQTLEYAELIPGGRSIDSVLAAVRRVDGDTSWRALTGSVRDSLGAPLAGAAVHVVRGDMSYATRAYSDAAGNFTVNAPPGAVSLIATREGYPTSAAFAVADGAQATPAVVTLPAVGTIDIHTTDAGSAAPLPVRVQVIPTSAATPLPDEFGVEVPHNGRSHVVFTVDGHAQVSVVPGMHRVVVTRGTEWELYDQMIDVQAGQVVPLDITLQHSVDSTGVMCADFHIHSFYSADASDPVEFKVRGALADGLEIPVSSEHEWIVDFQPVIQKLGVTHWAFGFPSEEFTTFLWGHFGVVPINARPTQFNNGAVNWLGKKPPEVFADIAALPENPVLIVNHPRGGSSFTAYFNAVNFDRTAIVGDPDLWSDQFEAIEVFNGSSFDDNRTESVADWFGFLNAGRKMIAVGNSDSHHLSGSPVGYPRTCLSFGHDDPTRLTANAVRDALRSGNAVVSGGLYMTVAGPGGARPGGTVDPGVSSRTFNVSVQAPSWLSADSLEVIVDGETTQMLTLQESGTGPARRYDAAVDVTASATRAQHWVVFHAKAAPGKDLSPLWPGRTAYAVSNPIWF